MDQHRLDAWAKHLGAGASRRTVLKGIVAGIGGGAFALAGFRTGHPVSAQTCLDVGEACEADVNCCTGLCGPNGCFEPEAICSQVDEMCGFSEGHDQFFDCCEGLHCNGEVCAEPQPTCVDVGEACGGLGGDGLVECCDGATCISGLCVADEPICLAEGEVCVGDPVPPACCGDLHCNGSVCVPPQQTCVDEGEACGGLGGDGAVECCGDLRCEASVCVPPPPTDTDDGAPVTTLPSTGAGTSANQHNWLIPATMGGAAVIAGAHLRRKRLTDTTG